MAQLFLMLVLSTACFAGQWLKECPMVTTYAQLDGIDGKITVPDNPIVDVGTGNFSVFFKIIKTQAVGLTAPATAYVVSKYQNSPMQGFNGGVVLDYSTFIIHQGYITIRGGYMIFMLRDAVIGSPFIIQGTKTVDDGLEHTVCLTIDRNGDACLYVDGVLDVALPMGEHGLLNLSTPADLLLGTCYDYYAPESIGDFRLYKEALVAADVARLSAGKAISAVPSWRIDLNTVDGNTIRGVKANGFEYNCTKNDGVTLVEIGLPVDADPTAVLLADAVVSTLNETDYGVEFTATRTLWPHYELKDLSTLRVTVVPKSLNVTMATRSSSEFDYEIDIAIQKAIKSPDHDDIKSLTHLAVSIAKSFRHKVYANLRAVCFKQTIDPLYSVEHIQPPSVFTSVVTLNFKVIE